jgi:16S rRNA (cytidine1402-2'-O)-methyltransferase
VVPVPGPSALLAGLTGSGFPSHRFVFEGFLPRKKGRKTLFESWIKESRTIIFYESPMRILKSLRDIHKIIGKRNVCVARELTKIYEEFIRGDIEEVIEQIENRDAIKGEIVVLLAPANFQRLAD